MAGGSDHYQVLGVERAARTARIRQAYRRLVRRYHPDLNPGDPLAAARYREIHAAWLILRDPGKRSEYDRTGAGAVAAAEPKPRAWGFAGFDFANEPADPAVDLREVLGKAPEPRAPETPPDLHSRVKLSFREALEGRSVRLRVARRETCPPCEGSGTLPREESVPCAACAGKGRRFRRVGHMVFSRACARCEGRGLLGRGPCDSCGGRGARIRVSRELVRVPAGVADGATVVVSGKGHERAGDGRPGDLHLHVQVEPHELLERRGDNLICPLTLTLREAALGGRIEVPTPSGPVTLRLPPGMQPGARLRVAERGARSARGDTRGDLYFEVNVRIPEVRDDRSRELVEELDRRNAASPREGMAERLGGGSA